MSDRLPPLTALRAFEAAARHLSFARAADELGVTPAALSFQIKSLETHLGAPVFRRLNRAVELTEAGRALQPGTAAGFDALSKAWRGTRRLSDSSTLTITAGPAFTAKWLAPRLFKFAGENPDIELRFSASLRLMDFARDEVDVAIRFGQSSDEGLYSLSIIDEWITPMLSPKLADSVKTPADLAKLPLLQPDDIAFLRPPSGWPEWFAAAGLPPPPAPAARFSQSDHAIDAAVASAGAVMGRASFAEAHLRDGQLVMPFDLALKTNAAYRIVCPQGHEKRPQIARFIAWVREEVRSLDAVTATRRFPAT